MTKAIDNALLRCIFANTLLWSKKWDPPKSKPKIALIGEDSKIEQKKYEKYSLKHELLKKYHIQEITIFTERNKFVVEDGKKFDMLIGCRPCEADKLILESATKYNKSFILMPCTCGGIQRKIINLIREYSIITYMDTFSGQFSDGNYDSTSWIILFKIILAFTIIIVLAITGHWYVLSISMIYMFLVFVYFYDLKKL